jgi:hypothetical protein
VKDELVRWEKGKIYDHEVKALKPNEEWKEGEKGKNGGRKMKKER